MNRRFKPFRLRVSVSPFVGRPIVSALFFYILSFTLLCGAASKFASAQNQDNQNGENQAEDETIRGTVVNSMTHEPIGRAEVYSADNRFATMTDDQGHFEFTIPQSPIQQPNAATGLQISNMLMARKPGFLSDRNSAGRRPQIPGSGDVAISLTPEAMITGRVTLPSSDMPDGIQVQIYRRQVRDGLAHWVPQAATRTNSNGEFRFAELAAGSYRVGTDEIPDRDPQDFTPGGKVYGYPPVYFPSATSFLGSSTINLTAGQIFEADFSLTRQQYYAVKIALANLSAATGMTINVSMRGDGAPGYSLGNGPQYTIRGFLSNGDYVVEASTFGQESATGLMNLTIANAPVQDARMTLLPNGTIPVNVKEEFMRTDNTAPPVVFGGRRGGNFVSRGPRRYLNVNLEPASDFGRGGYASLRQPVNSNDEAMAIDHVQPGRYWVRVNSSRGYAASVSSGGTDLQHQPLLVGPGGSSLPIEITMRDDTASFDGTVEGVGGESGSSPGGFSGFNTQPAYVYCIPPPDSPGQFTQIFVSADGKFNSPEMPPGLYRVLAFQHPQDDLEYRNPEAMRAYESKGQVIRLTPGGKETVQLQLVTRAADDAAE